MAILDEDIEKIREATDIVALIGEQVALKRVGQRFVGLCPFHAEKTPSFNVNPAMGRYYCLAGETRVITWAGVRPIRELAGTTQRILTTNGQWTDAPFSSFGVQPLMKITVGRNRVRKELFATPEHRWFVRDGQGRRHVRTTAELGAGHALSWTFPHRLNPSVRLSPQGVAHGITFGDGTRLERGACVDLHGDKDAELLKWFPLNNSYQYTTSHRGIERRFLKVVDLPGYFKERPSLEESSSYLLGWLAGYFAADGCVAKDGTVTLDSANRDDLEYVRLICARLGIGTYGITHQMRVGMGQSAPSALYRIHLINEDLREEFFLLSGHRLRFAGAYKAWHRRGWVVKSVEETDRVEEVFCAVVDHTHAFALEDNILTGNCFGCQESGDAIQFVRETEQLEFVDAVERLAARANITLRFDDRAAGTARKRRARLVEAVAAAVEFYHRRLLEARDAGHARGYLRHRGFDGDAARRFSLGWAPEGWDTLSGELQKRGFARDDVKDAGLAFVNRVNKLQDQFRGRLLFPIFDAKGDPVGFGGRTLGDEGPKYKNSPDSVIYQKSRLLYGLNWAKGEVVARGEIVICEGYTDVMACHLDGVPTAVATCGTALADEHFQILKNLARKIVLAYDADSAGQSAAERAYQWEQQFEVEFRVAELPGGQDPADVWHDDPAALEQAVSSATPFLQFRLDRVLAAADTTTPEGRARAADAVLPVIHEHPNELVREGYIQRVAGALGVDHAWFKEAIARRRPPARPEADTAPPRRAVVVDRREADVLRWAIHEPELVADWLEAPLFGDPVAREAFELLAESPTFNDALNNSEGSVRELLERLAVEEPRFDAEPETIRRRLLVNMAEPAGERLEKVLLEAADDRTSDVSRLMSDIAGNRDDDHAQDAALRLVELVVAEANDATGPARGTGGGVREPDE
jgi:DNA primase